MPEARVNFPLHYSFADGRKDLLAGLTVAAISLPQGMAYALIAGVDPRYGLYSAMVVTAVASIFGSSSHLINGPTSAISLLVFSALAEFDPEARVEAAQAMFLIGIMAGTMQIFIAVFKLGDLTRYISESVILGFMAGAAVLLGLGQIGNALGMRDKGTGDQHVLHRLWLTLAHGDPVNVKAFVISAATIALALFARKLVQRYRLPQMDMLLVLILVALFAHYAGWTLPSADGKTAVAVVGTVPASLPPPHIPDIRLAWIGQLSSGALAVAFLGLIEALAIAKSIANQTQQKLDYNRQCLAEGLANLAGGFFQCLPGSGSLSRSAINFQAGAVSRFSGIVTSATVALAVLALAPLTQFIPKPALAGLLLVTAVRLIDVGRIGYALRGSPYDAGLVIVTALSGLLVSVDASVLIGFSLSVLLFVPRAAKLKAYELVVSPERVVRERLPSDPLCTAFILYDFEGELFFGAAPELDRYFAEIEQRAYTQNIRHIVLRLKRVRNPDVVCLERFEHFLRTAEKAGLIVLLAGVRADFLIGIKRLRFAQWYPFDRVFPEQDEEDSATLAAVRSVYELLGDANPCPHCAPASGARKIKDRFYYLV
ncbi:MAG TPA: SulP family inorganic anion transporter [Xanthobacteraceae bacterium]|nr:SulP family inorganic anion transporter [Xanthobacteraceae bacterium]